MKNLARSGLLAAALFLGGCGNTMESRFTTGAILGAGVGAGAAAATGGTVLTGAALGAGLGGVIGALSD